MGHSSCLDNSSVSTCRTPRGAVVVVVIAGCLPGLCRVAAYAGCATLGQPVLQVAEVGPILPAVTPDTPCVLGLSVGTEESALTATAAGARESVRAGASVRSRETGRGSDRPADLDGRSRSLRDSRERILWHAGTECLGTDRKVTDSDGTRASGRTALLVRTQACRTSLQRLGSRSLRRMTQPSRRTEGLSARGSNVGHFRRPDGRREPAAQRGCEARLDASIIVARSRNSAGFEPLPAR